MIQEVIYISVEIGSQQKEDINMAIKMLNDYVLIKLNDAVTVSKGGIVLTNVVEPPCIGTILSVGEGKVLNNGQRAEHNMQSGDVVVFGKASLNMPLKDEDDGNTYYVMRIEDIFGKKN